MTDNIIYFYPNRKKVFLLCIGSVVLTVIGFWMMLNNSWIYIYSPFVTKIFGFCSFIFFGLGSLFFSTKLLLNKPSLTLDPQKGIKDTTSPLCAGWIYKEEISGIRNYLGWIEITVRNDENIFLRMPIWKKIILSGFRGLAKGVNTNNKFFIEPTYLNQPIDEIIKTILKKFSHIKSSYFTLNNDTSASSLTTDNTPR